MDTTLTSEKQEVVQDKENPRFRKEETIVEHDISSFVKIPSKIPGKNESPHVDPLISNIHDENEAAPLKPDEYTEQDSSIGWIKVGKKNKIAPISRRRTRSQRTLNCYILGCKCIKLLEKICRSIYS